MQIFGRLDGDGPLAVRTYVGYPWIRLWTKAQSIWTIRRPCSDSRHVTAPYKLALYYYYY